MIPKDKLEKIKQELDSYTDVALISVLYDRIVADTTKAVVDAEKETPVSKGYPITCSRCGKDTTVPFKPAENQRTPLLCIDCYNKKKKGEL